MSRIKLPLDFENKYKSEGLKERIVDDGMWALIPSVTYSMGSRKGIKRIEENDLLFSFIDKYFPEEPYAFEPNMLDGRFVLLPDNVSHQGMGVCVSKDLPGFLDVCHFWYPCEYTEKTIGIGPSQIFVPIFMAKPGDELAQMVRKVYMEESNQHDSFCTFPFNMDLTVKLNGYFLDDLNRAEKTIRRSLRKCSSHIQRSGEELIGFMERIMS